ncbi:hypothetical protein BH11GEM2_BH11GEM2_38670 [soil metagenome]
MDASGTIEIHIHILAELFNSLDPSPLHTRALAPSAEHYLISCAGARRANASLQLRIHCPASLEAHRAEVSDGIRAHFRRAHALGQRTFKRRLRMGAGALAGGVIVLALSVGLRGTFGDANGRGLGAGFAEGLLILGWVAMWRPIEILLYAHWEGHLDHAVLDRLARIPVEYCIRTDATACVIGSV